MGPALSYGTDAEIEIKKKEAPTEVALHFNVRSVRAPIRSAINLGFEIGRFLDEPRCDLGVFR